MNSPKIGHHNHVTSVLKSRLCTIHENMSLSDKGDYVLEVSNESGSTSARIVRIDKDVHTIVAQVTIPAGKTEELLHLSGSASVQKRWKRLIPDSFELHGLLPVAKWNLKEFKKEL